MKRLIILLSTVLVAQLCLSQNLSPLITEITGEKEQKTISSEPAEGKGGWDLLYNINLGDTLMFRGAETDGQYIYASAYWSPEIAKFDMQGNFIEYFTIEGVTGMHDLAYDGQYFYGGHKNMALIHVMDFENEVLIKTLHMPFKARSLAYNHVDNVFYSNYHYEPIRVFTSEGVILDSIPLDDYDQYAGFTFDNWSEGGPYLWGFSRDGYNMLNLVQLTLPDMKETGFIKDLSYISGVDPDFYAGGIFTYPDPQNPDVHILGGIIMPDLLFGLELGQAVIPPDSLYSATHLHGALQDSVNVKLTWSPARFNILDETFNYTCWPPHNWQRESEGVGWVPHVSWSSDWDVPDWDSRYAATSKSISGHDMRSDYFITPPLDLGGSNNFRLAFDSYFDGTNYHIAQVVYCFEGDTTWELIYELIPDTNGFTHIDLDLSSIPAGNPGEMVNIAFFSSRGNGMGSGWIIDNILVYSDDVNISPIGYEVYRDGNKLHTGILTDTSLIDQNVAVGTHEYYVETIYSYGSVRSGAASFYVPDFVPPPSPDCNPPQNLEAELLSNDDIELIWNTPAKSFSSTPNREAWDVEFVYPLAMTGEAGITSDGSNFYTTNNRGYGVYIYDLNGNYIEPVNFSFLYYIRNIEYCSADGRFYYSRDNQNLEMADLVPFYWYGNLDCHGKTRAIAYDEDLDLFYVNDRYSEIRLVDRISGDLISSFECGYYRNYYDFAYDNVSEGGPYLWGFSQEESGCTIVQISLPDGKETGFTYNASWLSTSGSGEAGGLFVRKDGVNGTATLVGVIQDEVMFGLELGAVDWNFNLDGYNVFMNGSMHNNQVITDTTYLVPYPGDGEYSFEVSAVYVDSIGDPICESEMEGPVIVTIDNLLMIGGNTIVGAYKLDEGSAKLYKFQGNEIEVCLLTDITDLGYFLFPQMTSGSYRMHVSPGESSAYSDAYVPTYYGDQIHWEDVPVVNIEENSFNNDIHLVEMLPYESGAGIIGGKILKFSTSLEFPVEDVLVMLLNEDGNCIAHKYSNSSGYFTFKDLAFGDYYILIEITGKTMNPVLVSLKEEDPAQTSMTFYVNNNEIFLGIGDEYPAYISMISGFYPHPVQNKAFIDIYVEESVNLKTKLFDITNTLIREEVQELTSGKNVVKLQTHQLNTGLYYVVFEFMEQDRIARKLLIVR